MNSENSKKTHWRLKKKVVKTSVCVQMHLKQFSLWRNGIDVAWTQRNGTVSMSSNGAHIVMCVHTEFRWKDWVFKTQKSTHLYQSIDSVRIGSIWVYKYNQNSQQRVIYSFLLSKQNRYSPKTKFNNMNPKVVSMHWSVVDFVKIVIL